MPISRHTFAKLDADTEPSAAPSNSFSAALNIALEPGYITAVGGNVAVDYDLPTTALNRRLGGFVDGASGTAVTLLYNSEGAHRLVRYDPNGNGGAGSETTILEWAGLSFARDLVPQGGILDGLLTYLGADGLLRCVNLSRAESGYYTPAVLAAEPYCLHLTKVPPTMAPAAQRVVGTANDPRQALRIIQRKAYQFALRWTYLDGEQTILSPYSDWLDVLDDPATSTLDTIALVLPPAPLGVSEVEVLGREPDAVEWSVIDTLRRDGTMAPATAYNFYGVVSGATVTPADAARLYESEWPGTAAVVANNRILKANLLEGYPTPEPAFTAQVHIGNGSTILDTVYEVLVEAYEPGDPSQNGEPVPDKIVSYRSYYVLATGTYRDPASTYYPVQYSSPPGGATVYVVLRGVTVDYATAFTTPIAGESFRQVAQSQQSLSASLTDPRTFHESSTYRVAAQFYDAQGKSAGASAAKTVFIPKQDIAHMENRSILATLTTTDLTALNAEIPAWAASYQFVVARNDRTVYFLQGRAADVLGYIGHKTIINDTNGDVDEIDQFVDGIHTIHQKLRVDIGNWPAMGQGYVWEPGSGAVLRFIQDEKEFVITGQFGDYLEVAWDGYPLKSVDSAGNAQARIELYIPNTTSGQLYYERGPRLPIIRTVSGGVEQRSYSQTQVVLGGDCFLVPLAFPLINRQDPDAANGTYVPPRKKEFISPSDKLLVESMVPPYRLAPSSTTRTVVHERQQKDAFDGFFGIENQTSVNVSTSAETVADTAARPLTSLRWLDVSYGGRPALRIPRPLQQVRRRKLIRFSGVKVSGTLLNGLSRWDALSQYDGLPEEQGGVVRLSVADQVQSEGSIVLANQEAGAESLSLGQRKISTADDAVLVAISNQVIGGSNALRGGFGCTDPASVVAYAGKVFYFCRERTELLRYDRNGTTPLALTHKARTLLGDASRLYVGAAARGCFHPHIDRKEYYLTFDATDSLPGLTLVYSDLYEAWSGAISYRPEAGLALESELLSYLNGAAYRHTPEAPAATFAGNYTPPSVTFTVAAPGGIAKLFKDVAIESRSLWLPTAIATDTGLASLMREGWFTEREGIYRAGFHRASNSPGFPTAFHALANGLPLIGSRQTITLTAPTDAAPLTACSVSWTPRSGQAMDV